MGQIDHQNLYILPCFCEYIAVTNELRMKRTKKFVRGGYLIIQGVLKIFGWGGQPLQLVCPPPPLFFPCQNNKKNKSPHQNLPEGSKVQVCNFARGLNLMEDNF